MLYFICFFSIFFALVLAKPLDSNFDTLAYVASAKSWETSNAIEIHQYAYDELQAYAAEDDYDLMISGEYRQDMFTKVDAFMQQLPFYDIRVVYVGSIYVLSNLGLNPYFSAHLVSALTGILGLVVLLRAFSAVVHPALLFSIPFFVIPLGFYELVRLGTPDALSFFAVSLLIYFYMKSRWNIMLVLLPFLILVRTDLLILVVIFAGYMVFIRRDLFWKIVASLAVTLLLYFSLNIYFGNYGWSTVFYVSFIDRVSEPAMQVLNVSVGDYVNVFSKRLQHVLTNSAFLMFLGLLTLSGVLYYLRNGIGTPDFKSECTLVFSLLVIMFFYLCLHYLSFPAIWMRFFVAQYCIGLFVFLAMISLYLPRWNQEASK